MLPFNWVSIGFPLNAVLLNRIQLRRIPGPDAVVRQYMASVQGMASQAVCWRFFLLLLIVIIIYLFLSLFNIKLI